MGHNDPVVRVAFSPDSRRLATASLDRTVRIWDIETHEQLAVLAGHEEAVWSVAFSPDGRNVVTASPDMTARIWDAEPRPPA